MNDSRHIGWDIGGAHLKVASISDSGKVELVDQIATPLWKGIEELELALPKTMELLPRGTHHHVVTMTAELVDIFEDRESGINALMTLCEKTLGNNINLYSTDGGILSLDKAYKNINQFASSNWHASATYVASQLESGLFIDIGSTTTDIIPFSNKQVIARGVDDHSRLRFDELVYTGVTRSPLMTLASQVPFAGEWQNVAAEYFSNTADVYRVLGSIGETDDLMDTADGCEKDVVSSIRRLARMLGTDVGRFKSGDSAWRNLAQYYEEVQIQLISKAILRVLSNIDVKYQNIVGAGVGRFLAKKIAQRLDVPYVEFSDLFERDSQLSHQCNTCAPAVALAQLNRLSAA